MSNRTEAAQRKLRQLPPGDYRHCACSRLYQYGFQVSEYATNQELEKRKSINCGTLRLCTSVTTYCP